MCIQFGKPFTNFDLFDSSVVADAELQPPSIAAMEKAEVDARSRIGGIARCILLSPNQPHNELTSRYSQKMAATQTSPTHTQSSMSMSDYTNSLFPSSSIKHGPVNGIRWKYFKSFVLPLEERFKTWLREAANTNKDAEVLTGPIKTQSMCQSNPPRMLQFDALEALCMPSDTVEDVLKVLKKYAWLVQGIWVAKNSLLYGEVQSSESDAREYALMLFSKSHSIKSSDIRNAPKCLNAECLQAILKTLATERKLLHDWEFKEPADVSFIKNFPDIVREQENFWEETRKQWAQRSTVHETGSG